MATNICSARTTQAHAPWTHRLLQPCGPSMFFLTKYDYSIKLVIREGTSVARPVIAEHRNENLNRNID